MSARRNGNRSKGAKQGASRHAGAPCYSLGRERTGSSFAGGFALPSDRPPISRRSFAAEITLGAIAAVIAALWAVREWFRSRPAPARMIAGANEISVGGFKIFSYPRSDTPCILIRPAEDSYLAFSRICTHNSCPVAYNAARGEFDCPCHGGVFSASNGSVLAGPPRRPLPRILLERRGDEILATGVAAD